MVDAFFTKNHILQWKILNFGWLGVGVENFWTKVLKGTPLCHYTAVRKKYAKTAIGKSSGL